MSFLIKFKIITLSPISLTTIAPNAYPNILIWAFPVSLAMTNPKVVIKRDVLYIKF